MQSMVEAEAFSSILSHTCDATFWLAADGDTVLTSDQRLKAILGSEVQGSCLSQYMPEEEMLRLQCLTRNSERSSVRNAQLLHTTLNVHARHMSVDLFIVNRTSALAKPAQDKSKEQQRGFFIGLRQERPFEVDSVPGPEVALEKALVKHSDASEGSQHGSLSFSYTVTDARPEYLEHDSLSRNAVDASAQTEPEPSRPPGPRRLGKEVRLSSSQRLLPRFKETPHQTVKQATLDFLMTFNSCGKGCCAYHINLARLSRMVDLMLTERCLEYFEVHSDWQCTSCFSMNFEVDGDDDECCFCSSPRKQTSISTPTLSRTSSSSHLGAASETSTVERAPQVLTPLKDNHFCPDLVVPAGCECILLMPTKLRGSETQHITDSNGSIVLSVTGSDTGPSVRRKLVAGSNVTLAECGRAQSSLPGNTLSVIDFELISASGEVWAQMSYKPRQGGKDRCVIATKHKQQLHIVGSVRSNALNMTDAQGSFLATTEPVAEQGPLGEPPGSICRLRVAPLADMGLVLCTLICLQHLSSTA
eukprot:TRINITY_DN112158_c0_g1_i1.p1 TRINITY_DN112158_c0_g1~~TRINITY_DN112158_c0_g1_i1.p1  ORF type:complete len:541 (+),score=61.78 TRINITY_DN112158_c0_g1_i1:32-1624(+)